MVLISLSGETKLAQQVGGRLNKNSYFSCVPGINCNYFRGYLAVCDFPGRFFEERCPGGEKVLLGVFLQAAVAAAHRAIPRHLRAKLPDADPVASKLPF